jgi:hypothetical protein
MGINGQSEIIRIIKQLYCGFLLEKIGEKPQFFVLLGRVRCVMYTILALGMDLALYIEGAGRQDSS